MLARSLLVLAGGLVVARQGAADSPALLSTPGALVHTDSWEPSSKGDLAIDAGLLVGFPTALPTGLATGVTAGVQTGTRLAYGARIAWATATESSMAWQVTHHDVRVRATGALQHALGRGTVGLRLAVGATVVHEARLRNQGERAGLTGDELRTSATALLPAAELDAVVGVAIAGPWRVVLSGGPSVALQGGAAHASWTAQLGVAWQP